MDSIDFPEADTYVPGSDAHIKNLIADFDDPYYHKDKVDVDTLNVMKFHKEELVRRAVEYRCPPEKDKKALTTQYATISQKKMQKILQEKNDKANPDPHSRTAAQHSADLELELEQMEAEMQEREDRLKLKQQQQNEQEGDEEGRSGHLPISRRSSRDMGMLDTRQQMQRQRQADGEEEDDDYLHEPAFELDEYFLLHDEDDHKNYNGTATARKGVKRGNMQHGTGIIRRSMNRPFSASVTSNHQTHQRGSKSRSGLEQQQQSTYQDRHGSRAGWRAELMLPSPVNNLSAKFMRQRNRKAAYSSQELYKNVLDEAKLMQQKFLLCVQEANMFSIELSKGNIYRIVERDAMEDQEWNTLLGKMNRSAQKNTFTNTSSNAAITLAGLDESERTAASISAATATASIKEIIPRGTAQRIAKMLVEVTNPSYSVRYLGTDHFFREHGRLQNEAQKKKSVQCLKPTLEIPDFQTTTFGSGSGSGSPNPKLNPRKPRRGGTSSPSPDKNNNHNSRGRNRTNSSSSSMISGSAMSNSLTNSNNKNTSRVLFGAGTEVTDANDKSRPTASSTYTNANENDVVPSGTLADQIKQQQLDINKKGKGFYTEKRKDIEKQLQMILSDIVTKGREIQEQIDFIKKSGWNWLSGL